MTLIIEIRKECTDREINVTIKILRGEKKCPGWLYAPLASFSAVCATGQFCFVRPILTDICLLDFYGSIL